MFHVDQRDVGMVRLQPGAPGPDASAGDSDWLLVVGQHALPAQLAVQGSGPGYSLLRLPPRSKLLHTIEFKQPDRSVLAASSGLGDAEHWGSWTLGDTVQLDFAQPLPQRLTIQLRGHAYGPNVGATVIARVGTQQQNFRLNASDSEQDVTLQFDTDGQQRRLQLEASPSHHSAIARSGQRPARAGAGPDKPAHC
jgi:phosphoglycerol transferase